MTIYPVPLRVLTEYQFSDESDTLTVAMKQQILSDWQQFILTGFKQALFTPALHEYLFHHCGLTTQYGLHRYWHHQFNSEVAHFRAFINQFGGDRRHATDNDHNWLAGPSADLKAALCEEMVRLAIPLTQVLDDLERQHEEMIGVWHNFAQGTVGMQTLPASYQVSVNTRNLLAYAAHIAQKRPLQGLQTMMFTPYTQENCSLMEIKMATKQQRNPQRKVYWKDGLQALQQKEAQQATRHRMWQRMFAQAKTDLQTEEAVVFLGAENMEILRQSPAHPAESTRQTRPPLPMLLGAAITLAISATSYALSYYRVATRMQ